MRTIELVNEYAAEHLIISCDGHEAIAERIVNAGSVFGPLFARKRGDYASGTNHTLPTEWLCRGLQRCKC